MNVLVTGGAGYIGSHIVRVLASAGHTCVAYDNLCTGHAAALKGTRLIQGDINDRDGLLAALRGDDIEAVIHLAAFIEAAESVRKPEKYFRNNAVGGLTLLEAMRSAGVTKLVFSSTAGVYGQPARLPIAEADRTEPLNPYGASKLSVEYMLRAFARAYDMGFVSLRYFNVAGAAPEGDIGEDHRPETHLIPLVLRVAAGKQQSVKIFGDDYDTPDGACIRDYIHVMDLADAHVLALDAVQPGQMKVFNLGNGSGFSVKEIVETCREVTGHAIPAETAPRRPGDPPRLVASCDKAQAELGWRQRFSDVRTIVAHAWKWHSSHPNGYG